LTFFIFLSFHRIVTDQLSPPQSVLAYWHIQLIPGLVRASQCLVFLVQNPRVNRVQQGLFLLDRCFLSTLCLREALRMAG
jgi:hypothetical protein